MNKIKSRYTVFSISILQILLLGLPFLFEYLSNTKPLVMRHLYTKKLEHLDSILNVAFRDVYTAIALLIALILVIFVVKNINLKLHNLIFSISIIFILILMMKFNLFSENITFTYSIAILFVVLIMDIVKMFLKLRNFK